MKILWHFNSHRHFEEYYFSSQFFNRSNFFKKNADVLVTCNNVNIDLLSLKEKCQYECNLEIVRTTNPLNGVHTGQLVSLSETFEKFKDYDFVIHTTPDVYMVEDKRLISLLEQEKESYNSFIVDYHPFHNEHTLKTYSTDFFVFKPKKIENFFSLKFEPSEQCHCIEAHLYRVLHELKIPHRTINRGKTSLKWQVDDYGLIHNHNIDVIKNILINGQYPDEAMAYTHNLVK